MELMHGRVPLWLEPVSEGSGPSLLLLHGLGGSSGDWAGAEGVSSWAGPVFALDFPGHGRSGVCRGGAYSAEWLAADAAVALDRIGSAAVAGMGLGAYVALLLAGAQSDRVPAALLASGHGLEGGGPEPDVKPVRDVSPETVDLVPGLSTSPRIDPRVYRLEEELRPPGYARELAEAAPRLFLLEDGLARPVWWEALRGIPTVEAVDGHLSTGLADLFGFVTRC